MLRLIVEIGLAAPANDKDAGDAVDLPMQKREQGIDDIAEPAVLQVDERRLARREVIARRERRCIPLVCGDHMRGAVRAVHIHQTVDERAQLRVRHARVELRTECRDKIIDVHIYSLSQVDADLC